MRRLIVILSLQFIITAPVIAGPVIDMHFHAWPRGADGPPDHPANLEAMYSAIEQLEMP